MGFLRFLLAAIIVIDHSFLNLDFRYSVVATIFFMLMSGYATAASFHTVFGLRKNATKAFLTDRILRLYPVYLAVFVLQILLFVVVGPLRGITLTPEVVARNLIPVDLNLQFKGSIFQPSQYLALASGIVIPSAWYLSLLAQYYLLFGFVLAKKRQIDRVLFFLSAGFFLLGALGFLETELVTYRLLYGTLCIFQVGQYLYYSSISSKYSKQYVGLIQLFYGMVIGITFFLLLFKPLQLTVPIIGDTLLGIILGIPVMYSLMIQHKNTQSVPNPLDRLLGDLSYILFICHHLIVDSITYLHVQIPLSSHYRSVGVFMFSLLLAMVLYYVVDRPITHLRKRLKYAPTLKPKAS